MADPSDLSLDDSGGLQDYTGSSQLLPPPELSYPDKDTLVAAVKEHAHRHGYNVVTKTSSKATDQKPGRVEKVWLRCDRGGAYRPRNGLTEETRKRKRESRLIGCEFMVIATGGPGMWTVKVETPIHNHGPVADTPRATPYYKAKRGQVEANPYSWPHDASFSKFTTALVIIDMQRDFCEAGGYLHSHGYDIAANQALIPKLKGLLEAFREAEFPIYHTREGHRADLSTVSSREAHRFHNSGQALAIGDPGPLGRLLVRGEPGHDVVHHLYPLENEPIIDKPGRSAFAHTDFDLLLRIKGIKNLVVAGVTTDVSVSSTIREANDRGYDCLLIEDGTAATDPSLRHGACESIKMEGGVFGATGKLKDIMRVVSLLKIAGSKRNGRTGHSGSPETAQHGGSPPSMIDHSLSSSMAPSFQARLPLSAADPMAFMNHAQMIHPGHPGHNMIGN